VYTTPKSYLDLLNLFLSSLERKRQEFGDKRNKLSSGITKLEETNKTVAELQITLEKLRP